MCDGQVFARAVGIVSDTYTNVPCLELRVYSDQSLGWDCVEDVHAKSTFHACIWDYAHARNGRSCRSSGQWGTAALSASAASAYPYAASIDQEFARLTKDLELTPKQQQQVRPLLEEDHDRIQALLDKNPKASRQELGPQIHAISDETHRKIHGVALAQIFLNSRQGGKIWRPHIAGVDERKEVTELTISFWEQTFILPPFPLVPFL